MKFRKSTETQFKVQHITLHFIGWAKSKIGDITYCWWEFQERKLSYIVVQV